MPHLMRVEATELFVCDKVRHAGEHKEWGLY